MTDYVLATDPDEVDRRRMALLFAYHGPLRRGDFTELEFGGKGFDLITAQMLLMHLPNPPRDAAGSSNSQRQVAKLSFTMLTSVPWHCRTPHHWRRKVWQ